MWYYVIHRQIERFRKEGMAVNRKLAAGVAVTVAVASIATNLAFQPEELLHSHTYLENHIRYVQEDDGDGTLFEYTEQEKLGKKDQLRLWLLKLPVPVKALFLLPLWALGAVPVALGTALAGALSPIWAQLLGFVLEAGLLTGVFCLVYKLIFPKRKLRELFRKKNRRWILAGAAALTAVNFALSVAWPGWSPSGRSWRPQRPSASCASSGGGSAES